MSNDDFILQQYVNEVMEFCLDLPRFPLLFCTFFQRTDFFHLTR